MVADLQSLPCFTKVGLSDSAYCEPKAGLRINIHTPKGLRFDLYGCFMAVYSAIELVTLRELLLLIYGLDGRTCPCIQRL